MLFLGLWILLLFVVFIFGNIQRTRYFLPAYPHLAILTSLLLCTGFRDRATTLKLKRLFLILCWLIFGAGVVMTLAGVRIHLHLLVSGVIIAGLALFLITRTSRWAPAFFMAGFAVLIMTFSSIWDIGVRPLFFISAAPDITRQILLLEPAGTPVAMGGVSVIDESQIRVLSGGRVKPFKLSPTPSPEEISQVSLLVCNKRDFEQGKLGTGTVVGQASGFGGWRARDITALLSSKKKAAVWAARKQEYVLVRPHHSVAQ
jgi:hypothetical protein